MFYFLRNQTCLGVDGGHVKRLLQHAANYITSCTKQSGYFSIITLNYEIFTAWFII